MTETTVADQPLWLRVLQFPLTRIVVFGFIMLYFMGWAEARLEQLDDTSPC